MRDERDVRSIMVDDVVPDTAQPRQDWDRHRKDADGLSEDIKNNGMYYPIIVAPFYINSDNEAVIGEKADGHKKRKWWILDGERRWRCIKSMGETNIDAIVRTELNMMQMYEIQFASNTKRLQVTIREMSRAVERYREEYRKECSVVEGYLESMFIKTLCRLTGYSSSYFMMVEAINRADEDVREAVLSEKIGGYAPHEIERATSDSSFRRGISDAFVESDEPISALVPRAIKYDLKDADKSRDLDSDEKRILAKQMVIDFVKRRTSTKDEKPNFLLYEQKASKFRRTIKNWNLEGLSDKQIGSLVGIIEDIYTYFKESRRVNNQLLSNNDRDNIIGTKSSTGIS